MIVVDQKSGSSVVNFASGKFKESIFRINLSWTNSLCWLDRIMHKPKPILSMGCFYEMTFGGKSIIDRIQFRNNSGPLNRITRQGCFTMIPYIWHEGVEKANRGETSESMIINLDHIKEFSRLTLYSIIVKGKPRWKRIKPVLTLEIPGEDTVIIPVEPSFSFKKRLCAICNIQIKENQMEITFSGKLYKGHKDCNSYQNWNLNVV